jgi:hypothetical protein
MFQDREGGSANLAEGGESFKAFGIIQIFF